MTNLLLTFGCSFTYGEGLEFHYWREHYPDTFNLYKNKVTYYPSSLIMISLDELVQYREKNRWSGILKNFLGFNLMTKAENGGINYRNIERLELLIKYLKEEKKYVPKYCVFQLTSIIRDVVEFTNQNINDGLMWIGKEKRDELIKDIELLDDPMRRGNLNRTIADVFFIVVNRLVEQFNKLEKIGCKCLFFIGMEDIYSHPLIIDKLKENPYYFPIIFNRTEYSSWDKMNSDNYLTLRQNIDVNDDHPCLDSHKWLANTLYKKYLEMTR